jgi:hypothetical protein
MEEDYHIYATIVMKKAVPNCIGGLKYSDNYVIQGVARRFREHIKRKLGCRRTGFYFAAWFELGLNNALPHCHMIFQNPHDLSIERIQHEIAAFIKKDDWTRPEQFDCQAIYDPEWLYKYNSKQGPDSFIWEVWESPKHSKIQKSL